MAKAVAKAKAGARAPRAPLHRPAAHPRHRAAVPREGETVEDKWKRGETIAAGRLSPSWLVSGERVLSSKAYYYGAECKVAGVFDHCEVVGNDVKLHLKIIGTNSDALLAWASGQAVAMARLHLCSPSCNREEVADSLLHTGELRKMAEPMQEDGWASNLIPVQPEADELATLRERERTGAQAAPARKEEEKESDKKKRKESKEKKKDGKEDKESKKKKKRKRSSSSETSSQEALKKGKKSSQSGREERSPSSVFGHWAGPQRQGPEDGVQEGTEVHQEERQVQLLGKREFGEWGLPGCGGDGGRHHLCPGIEGEARLGEVSRGLSGSNTWCNAQPFVDGGWCGQQHQLSERHRPAVLSAMPPQTWIGASAAGNADPGFKRGGFAFGQGLTCSRPYAATPEKLRGDVDRYSLVGESTFRTFTSRRGNGDPGPGAANCTKGCLPGEQGEDAGQLPGREAKWSQRQTKGRQQRQRLWQGAKGLSQRVQSKRRSSQEERRQRQQELEKKRKGPLDNGGEQKKRKGHNELETGYDGGWATAPSLGAKLTSCPSTGELAKEDRGHPLVHDGFAKSIPSNSFQTPAPCEITEAGSGSAGGVVKTPGSLFAPEKKDGACSGDGMGGLVGWGPVLLQQLLEVLPLCSKAMGKGFGGGVYPLPTSGSLLVEFTGSPEGPKTTWLQCLCVALNSMWGGELFSDGPVTEVQRGCLNTLANDVSYFCNLECPMEDISWSEFFRVKSIDYKGDEVQVAQWFSWENISPALPREIGVVPLEELCEHGARHYVTHFDLYLKPREEWGSWKRPRVMVDDSDWSAVCEGLLAAGVCRLIPESEVFMTDQGPLLNGLFGVPKNEQTEAGVDIYRLIMNLVPLNQFCQPLSGDVDTLPSWGGMSPFFLQPDQNLLVSSEDVKCFFYTMRVPMCWHKYLAFNKPVPNNVLPRGMDAEPVYLCSQVLPMGFLNSVSLAQHVHRNLALWSGDSANAPQHEFRKDRAFMAGDSGWRIYLDNYDLLEKVKATEMVDTEHTTAPGVLSLRQEYERWDIPRNTKKAVERASRCEMQGATIDGIRGVAHPREVKLGKYFGLALKLCSQDFATQRQWQVVCGGLVYFAMFRRPVLGALNGVWKHIESYKTHRETWRPTPPQCKLEVLRFLGLLPVCRLDFRLDMHPQVSCSDASSTGGGVCASSSVTALGQVVASGKLRGDMVESRTGEQVLSIGLFDGIGALRVALDLLQVPVLAHISVESNPVAQRVVEAHFPGTEIVDDVQHVDEAMVAKWRGKYSQCSLIVLGGGPPCQGVSGLNADRRGALRDHRSCLFTHVPRIRELLQRYFPWCPVYNLMESVASMDLQDERVMSDSFGSRPLKLDAGGMTWCHRPRLYWLTWEVTSGDGVAISPGAGNAEQDVVLTATQPLEEVIRAGWSKVDMATPFPTFTTSRPRVHPGHRPAGIKQCTLEELHRWEQDLHRFPPYQYKRCNGLVNRSGEIRIPDEQEREMMMGFPLHYTSPCLPKGQRKGTLFSDTRLSLLGNSWNVPVVAWLLGQLFGRLGMIRTPTPQDVMNSLKPGASPSAQGRLLRMPLRPPLSSSTGDAHLLASTLGNLVSMKGEDLMVSAPTSQQVRFHRMRASVPSKLWKWSIVTGWTWRCGKEHINSLELRAILTAIRWRIEKKQQVNTRLLHLTDSLVCLHCLTRGRSSSTKLRRTMSRINALILAANLQPLWGYVHTDQNPADKPSRWGRRVRTKYRHAA
eukprot:Skav234917  [mRNA]  locus=scaffold840:917441:922639:+ [translate_table: standard]